MDLRFGRRNAHARSRFQITNPRDSRSAVSGVYRRVELPPTRQEQSYPPSMQMVEAGGHSADSKRSGEYGYGRGYCWPAASVARNWRCLLSFAAKNAAPAGSSQCTAIRNRAGLQTAIGNSTGVFACLPYDERAGERGSDKALDGSERLRSNGSHAVGNR
jgi:hypothetical protein